jgi:hypothetical protein
MFKEGLKRRKTGQLKQGLLIFIDDQAAKYVILRASLA